MIALIILYIVIQLLFGTIILRMFPTNPYSKQHTPILTRNQWLVYLIPGIGIIYVLILLLIYVYKL